MKLLKKIQETNRELVYIADRYEVEDEGEELRKSCYTLVMMRYLMKKYPDKAEELGKIYSKVRNMANNLYCNPENILKLEGMDMILYNLNMILSK